MKRTRLKWPISQLMAYTSAVYKMILKIPFFMKTILNYQNFESKFFLSHPQPGQARLIYVEMAYISVVYERVFKIPFFSESCNELKLFLNIFFCLASSLGRPGWYMLKWPHIEMTWIWYALLKNAYIGCLMKTKSITIHGALPVVSFAAGNRQIDLPLPPANRQNRQRRKSKKKSLNCFKLHSLNLFFIFYACSNSVKLVGLKYHAFLCNFSKKWPISWD